MSSRESGFLSVPATDAPPAGPVPVLDGGSGRAPLPLLKSLVLAMLVTVPAVILGAILVSLAGLRDTSLGWCLTQLPGGLAFGAVRARMEQPPGRRLRFFVSYMPLWAAVMVILGLVTGSLSLG